MLLKTSSKEMSEPGTSDEPKCGFAHTRGTLTNPAAALPSSPVVTL